MQINHALCPPSCSAVALVAHADLVTLTRRVLGACRPMSKIVPGAILLVMAYGIVSSDVFGITAPILGWSAAGSGTVADSLTSSGGGAVGASARSAAAQRTEYSDPFKLPWGYRPLVAQPCRWAAVPAERRHSSLAWVGTLMMAPYCAAHAVWSAHTQWRCGCIVHRLEPGRPLDWRGHVLTEAHDNQKPTSQVLWRRVV